MEDLQTNITSYPDVRTPFTTYTFQNARPWLPHGVYQHQQIAPSWHSAAVNNFRAHDSQIVHNVDNNISPLRCSTVPSERILNFWEF